MKHTRFKSSRPKTSKIRRSARGQECLIELPGVCCYQTETVVLCHKNGGGMGMKTPDENGAYGCFWCHMVLDGQHRRPAWLTVEDVQERFRIANIKTREILVQKNLLEAE